VDSQIGKLIALGGVVFATIGAAVLYWGSSSGVQLMGYMNAQLLEDVRRTNRRLRHRRWSGLLMMALGFIAQSIAIFV
jgi:hypothetical protein